MTAAKVLDAKNEWNPVPSQSGGNAPVAPVLDGNGKIFVSIVSYRDAERCGETLKSIFENAKHPSNVIVGLAEQNNYDDKFCLDEYCKSFGVQAIKKNTVREGVIKVVTQKGREEKCPHFSQVRLVAFFDIAAKGPIFARSMIRKVLGNEEFCLQVDAHTHFVKNWDEIAVDEWTRARNEFAVISTTPAPKADMDQYAEGSTKNVPRQCRIIFRENGFPDYQSPTEGMATDLEAPLLSHAWSAAFSFSKCHLEESAPYDPFTHYAMPIEQFTRYARFWTRGYDVYTPTRNIVFHDYGEQPNGHGQNEWFKRQRDRFRKAAIQRAKTVIQMPGSYTKETELANLGIYGLGKRRTLKQLMDFTKVDLAGRVGNNGYDCADDKLVPYDASISPVANLYDNPDNLEPQPEYPLRTQLTYYQQVVEPLMVPAMLHGNLSEQHAMPVVADNRPLELEKATLPPVGTLFVLWMFGLVVWCVMFMNPSGRHVLAPKKRGYGDKDV